MGSEIDTCDVDWDYPLTEEDLAAIDAACASAGAAFKRPGEGVSASGESPPRNRRRLPDSLFDFQQHCRNSNSNNLSSCSSFAMKTSSRNNNGSAYPETKFGGRIIYSRTLEEVEAAAQELLDFVEAKKRKEGHCVLGLDIEWRPALGRGVASGKAAVMQICGDNNRCYVMHVIHCQIPKNLQCLLEDSTSLKVGVCIANDAAKLRQDYAVSVCNLCDLSDIANTKLGGEPKRWSLSRLTEILICRKLPKPNQIRLGNWEVDVLSKDQLKYAATDAYVSWFLYQVLRDMPDPASGSNTTEINGRQLKLRC